MTNARLIEELAASQAVERRRADEERALREIAARITAIRDPSELLQDVVDEAARLLHAERVRIDLIGHGAGRVGYTFQGAGPHIGGAAVDAEGEPFRYGASGKAIEERRTIVVDDYFTDDSFEHVPDLDKAVGDDGIRSLVITPLIVEDTLLGVLQVGSADVAAFGPEQVALAEALAHQAAIAIRNSRLVSALERSGEEISRRADAERAVREIAANISALRDTDAILQQTVDEARRLLDSTSARIDMLDDDGVTLRWAYASGEDAIRTRKEGFDAEFRIGEGIAGRTVAHGEAFTTGDYLRDPRFEHVSRSDALVKATGFRSVLAAPLRGESGSLGAISVSSTLPDHYDANQAELLQGLADQAAIAIQNARLIQELDRSSMELARRADAEQSLREIAAQITAIRDSRSLLQQVVDAARRLVDADGSVLDLLEPDGSGLRWAFDAGVAHLFTADEIALMTIPIGVGATGQAVAENRVIMAADDPRSMFPDSEVNDRFFDATGFRSMIVAPVRGESGPLGALEVYSRRPNAFDENDAGVLAVPRRPGRDRDHQRTPDRRPGAFPAAPRRAGRDRALAARHRRADHVAARSRRAPGPRRRGIAAAPRLRRRAPDADVRRRHVPRPGHRRRRDGCRHGELAQGDAVPARRRDQRSGSPTGHTGLDGGLRGGPADPARAGRQCGGRAARSGGDGGGAAPGAGG